MSKPKTKSKSKSNSKPGAAKVPYMLRHSPIHGTGLFARRDIKKGAPIIEYVGERISHEEADRRHEKKAADDNHTFLFTVDDKIVIDAGTRGNDARFINHSCSPNCEVIIDDGRLFVESTRLINSGEEIFYDYNITRSDEDPATVEKLFACLCGNDVCRGNMLEPIKKPKKKSAKSKSKSKAKAAPARGKTTKKRKKNAKSKKR